jgi:hypothetical protein
MLQEVKKNTKGVPFRTSFRTSLLEGHAMGLQPLEKNGGLDRTRICDLLRVKQAL